MSRLARWAGCALLLLVFAAPAARAQQFEQGWSDPRLISPAGLGPRYSGLIGAGVGLVSKKPSFGVSAGEFVLQPRLFLESEYRSNFFRIDPRNGDPEGALALHVRPGLALFNPDYDDVALSFGVDLDVFVPFGEERVTDRTNIGGVARVAVGLFPRAAISLTLHETFERTLWMRPMVTRNANRNHNVIGADLGFHPGGRALDFTLGYAYELERYDHLDRLDADTHHLRFLGSWRFYPMTYTFLESMLAVRDYVSRASGDEEAIGNLVPGTPFRIYAGLSGLVIERLALLVRAGFGDSFLEQGEDFSSFVGMLQASWRFSSRSVVHVGFARDFEEAPLGGFVEYVRPYLAFTQRFGEIAELNVDFAYDYRTYGRWEPTETDVFGEETLPIASQERRREGAIRAGVVLDLDVSRLVGATIGYRFDGVISDFALLSQGVENHVGYDDHRLFASLNLRY